MMEGIKRGILRGFLELDEKLRKIPEVIPAKLLIKLGKPLYSYLYIVLIDI